MASKNTKLNIIGTPYELRMCKKQEDVDLSGRDILSGQVNFEKGVISIYTGGSQEDVEDTLLHEIFHTVIYHLFRQREDCRVLFEEDVVEPLVSCLRDTLIRNKLIKFTL